MVVHVTSLPEQPITVSFTHVDAAHVLRRLFGAHGGFALAYGAVRVFDHAATLGAARHAVFDEAERVQLRTAEALAGEGGESSR
jgi:hypothetical protein